MKKALVLFLSAILLVSLFVSCGPEPILEIIVKYDGNGSISGSMENQVVVKGEEFELSENKFEGKEGYKFLGWNTKSDGSGTMYPDGDTVRFLEDITLYAQWGFNGVAEIKYDANGGQGTMLPQWVIKGIETTLRQNRFSRDGYFFTGWKDDNGTWYSDADTAKFENDVTILHAQWHKDVAKIIFNSNGDGGLMFPQWVDKGEETALKPNKFNWKGHYFTSWNTKKDGSGTEYKDGAKIKTNTDVTLYAQWIMDISTMDDKTFWSESDGKYFTISADVTIDERVDVSGDIILILPEGKTLTANMGINVSTDNALTIEGKGNLNATGGDCQAGIGGYDDENCGTVTITGGTVNTKGGRCGAGIGGGYNGYGGTVTITGGKLTATGGYGAAGIGGGYLRAGGALIISGGTVTATGGDHTSAGIGGGSQGGRSAPSGRLTIGYDEIQSKSLEINTGWSLYYGNSENPTDHVDGKHNKNDLDNYAKQFMRVEKTAK